MQTHAGLLGLGFYLWHFDIRVSACRGPAMDCMSTDSADSSSRFPLTARTNRQTKRWTDATERPIHAGGYTASVGTNIWDGVSLCRTSVIGWVYLSTCKYAHIIAYYNRTHTYIICTWNCTSTHDFKIFTAFERPWYLASNRPILKRVPTYSVCPRPSWVAIALFKLCRRSWPLCYVLCCLYAFSSNINRVWNGSFHYVHTLALSNTKVDIEQAYINFPSCNKL